MAVCSELVRCCKCRECRYYAECAGTGVPSSPLGRYLAHMNLEVLPKVEKRYWPLFRHGIHIVARRPTMDEGDDGRYATLRVYDGSGFFHAICRIAVNGDEDERELMTLIFNQAVRAEREKNNARKTGKK